VQASQPTGFRAFCVLSPQWRNPGDQGKCSADLQIIAGLAVGSTSRLMDEKNLPFTSESQKQKFKAEVQVAATRDAKRALRESGFYEASELDPVNADEKHGHKIM